MIKLTISVIVQSVVERGLVCDGCGQPIVNYGYCTPHEPGCDALFGVDECECALHYHSECCPECNAPDEDEDE